MAGTSPLESNRVVVPLDEPAALEAPIDSFFRRWVAEPILRALRSDRVEKE